MTLEHVLLIGKIIGAVISAAAVIIPLIASL